MTIDIEKLKKMNNLIKDLKHQGFASNSNDALQQASGFYSHDLGGVVPEQKQKNYGYDDPKPTASKLETPADSPQISEAYLETKFQLILEMNNKRFNEEFNKLHSKITSLNDEMSSLRMELRKANEFKSEKPRMSEPQMPMQQQLPVEQKKEDHPRQGKYTSQDVPIDQFFKFGPGGKR